MTQIRSISDYRRTKSGHQHQENQQEASRSISTGSADSSTATRVCACAREAGADERAAMLHGQYVDICDYFARSFHRAVAPGIQRELATRIKGGMSADVIRAAIDDTMMAQRPSWAYCSAILRNCDAEGIKTMKDWMQRKARYQGAKNPALDYEQRTYTEDMFGEDFFVDLDQYGG